MKEIQLTQGMVALVDDEDYERLSQYKWSAVKQGGTYYAIRSSKDRVTIRMHREVLGLTDRKIFCDHINHNGVDNQKHNLRTCTATQNQHNQISRTGVSKYKGVSVNGKSKKWLARIGIDYMRIVLGYYNSEEEAAMAYDAKARELYGEFACCNFN